MHGTQQVSERRGLGDGVFGQIGAGQKHLVEHRRQIELQPLGVVSSGEPKPHRREEQSAQRLREEKLLGEVAPHFKRLQDGTEHGRVVLPQLGRLDRFAQRRELFRKNPGAGVQKRSALRPAGPIGDVVRQEEVGSAIQAGQGDWNVVSSGHQRQAKVARLPEGISEEGAQLGGVDELLLRRGLEAARMSEASGRKRRVRKLEDEPGRRQGLLQKSE